MVTLTTDEVSEAIIESATNTSADNFETDNDGQVIIYTGIYRWADGSYHDEAEIA